MKGVFSPAAEADLTESALDIAEDNPTRSISFVAELEATIELLGDAPAIGRARQALGEGMRALPRGNYLMQYRQGDDARADRAKAPRRGQHHGDRPKRRLIEVRHPRHGRV